MALSESALSDLLASLQAADGVDLVRELARWALRELIEVEATSAVGAGRYERSDARITERNGPRPRVVSTKAGDLHVAIPKLRQGSFFPSLLEPRRRIDQALYAVVMAPLCVKPLLRGCVGGRRGGCERSGRRGVVDAAHGFAPALAGGDLASVVVLSCGGLADLGERHDVERRVELAVADS